MSNLLILSRETAKYLSQTAYGIRKELPDEQELLSLLNKEMMINVLATSVCLSELTTDEISNLTNVLSLKI